MLQGLSWISSPYSLTFPVSVVSKLDPPTQADAGSAGASLTVAEVQFGLGAAKDDTQSP